MKQPTEIFALIEKEEARQKETINLIASENYFSENVRKALSRVLMKKYAEAYPGKRFCEGCEVVVEVETLAKERARRVWGSWTAVWCVEHEVDTGGH